VGGSTRCRRSDFLVYPNVHDETVVANRCLMSRLRIRQLVTDVDGEDA
jgi:hypothetical protein